MRILTICPHYVPAYHFGGPLNVAHSLSKALVKAGHQVTVCTTNLKNHQENLDVPVDTPVSVDGVEVYYEPVFLFRYWGFSPGLWTRMAREVNRADVILVHAHYQFANWGGAKLARRSGKPYVIFAHGSLHFQGISHKSARLKQLYLTLMERINFQNALFIVFNAPEEKDASMFGELGKVIPSGIDPASFATMPLPGYFRELYPQLQDKPFILFLGRLDIQQKGLDLLIPAFGQLRRVCPGVHLVLAGPDEDEGGRLIRHLALQHEVEDAVTLTGLISGQAKLAALQDADLFVLPSRFEGLSIALLEALYSGLPVVVTDRVGLWREVEKNRCGLVVPYDEDSLAGALKRMAMAPDRREMGQRGRQLVAAGYTWDKIARHLAAEIEQALTP